MALNPNPNTRLRVGMTALRLSPWVCHHLQALLPAFLTSNSIITVSNRGSVLQPITRTLSCCSSLCVASPSCGQTAPVSVQTQRHANDAQGRWGGNPTIPQCPATHGLQLRLGGDNEALIKDAHCRRGQVPAWVNVDHVALCHLIWFYSPATVI